MRMRLDKHREGKWGDVEVFNRANQSEQMPKKNLKPTVVVSAVVA